MIIDRCTLWPTNAIRGERRPTPTRGKDFECWRWRGPTGKSKRSLSFLGLALFWDPPRSEVPDAVRSALAAGIRIVMITGDHPATALAVAHQIGIPGVRVLTGEDLDRLSGH